ncbi:MAG: PASTA domain-containing protein [Acidobacteria bacterium]|nr:PASTA domain-containing protein [Acidobacteriota bacterium]
MPAALTTKQPVPQTEATTAPPQAKAGESAQPTLPSSGTVVLEVEEGGISVPSFLGKNMRAALEAAQDAGLDLAAVGSGVAKEQSPEPGTKVAAGSRVVVRFGR